MLTFLIFKYKKLQNHRVVFFHDLLCGKYTKYNITRMKKGSYVLHTLKSRIAYHAIYQIIYVTKDFLKYFEFFFSQAESWGTTIQYPSSYVQKWVKFCGLFSYSLFFMKVGVRNEFTVTCCLWNTTFLQRTPYMIFFL